MIVGTSTNCSTVCSAKRTRLRGGRGVDEILGTSIACSGIGKSRCRHASTSWFSLCGTGTSSDGTTGGLSTICYHGAPLVPLLRPDANEAVRPSPFGVLVKQIEVHRILPGVGRPLAPWSVVRLGPCTSERRVVQGCGQLHAHGHPLVSQPRAEPALPPPPCGACGDAFSTKAIRWVWIHNGHTKGKRVFESNALLNGHIILKE